MTSHKHLKPQTTKWTIEITKIHRKLDKRMKKAQRSRYDQNDEIAVTQNNEKLKIPLNSLLHWPSKSQHIMSILTNH